MVEHTVSDTLQTEHNQILQLKRQFELKVQGKIQGEGGPFICQFGIYIHI
jgi:hypothetical protein